MASSRWRNLPLRVREVAVHEAGHGVVGEVLGWPVKYLRLHRSGGGVCVFRGKTPAPWVDLIVSAAGHAAECWWSGGSKPSAFSAYYDRRDARAVMRLTGVTGVGGTLAVLEVERQLWPVFTDERVRQAVRRVARLLGQKRHLSRAEFLEVADMSFGREAWKTVRRYCRRLAERVHSQHLEESS